MQCRNQSQPFSKVNSMLQSISQVLVSSCKLAGVTWALGTGKATYPKEDKLNIMTNERRCFHSRKKI